MQYLFASKKFYTGQQSRGVQKHFFGLVRMITAQDIETGIETPSVMLLASVLR